MKANVSKRLLAMLLCGAMAASLTACGGSGNGVRQALAAMLRLPRVM